MWLVEIFSRESSDHFKLLTESLDLQNLLVAKKQTEIFNC